MRNFLSILLLLIATSANAQIFTHKKVLDKFDDVVTQRDVKTLVQQNDTAFIIEEKGRSPETYIILWKIDEACTGSKDNISNIVQNIYGYEEAWTVVRESDFQKYNELSLSIWRIQDKDEQMKQIQKMADKYFYTVFHRVVTAQYTHDYITEMYWIMKGENNGRTIYSMKRTT